MPRELNSWGIFLYEMSFKAQNGMNNLVKMALPLIGAVGMTFQTARAQYAAKTYSQKYVVVTDYVKADGKTDVSSALQKLIDRNPGRTLYFPDGVYLLSRPILTSAHPQKSVNLLLSNYAVLKAGAAWAGGAMVRLGARDEYLSVAINASNYGMTGGIVDGSDVADGISIESRGEMKVHDVSIKHTRIGIHLKHAPNSGSLDADISDVNIVGNNTAEAIGVLVDANDNTFTNMRIARINKGFVIKGGGNSLRNIHPLYAFKKKDKDYSQSAAFVVEASNNFFSFCYSDQMGTGYRLAKDVSCVFTDCFCMWWNGDVPTQTVYEQEGTFESIVTNQKTGFNRRGKSKFTLLKAEKGGHGQLIRPFLQGVPLSEDDVSADYIRN